MAAGGRLAAGHYRWLVLQRRAGLLRSAELPELRWGKGETRLHPAALAKHGEKKARKIGYLAMFPSSGPQRSATPPAFRDVLLSIARAA